ncbi:MAG: YihY/virulence factor BrkB family protein [Bacteroidales bacterium]|nr:YihY/virulence factor BrkB family protein [Bacteroidales bacterium]
MDVKRGIRTVSVLMKKLGHFFSVDMWSMDLSSLSRMKAHLVRDLQIGYDVLKKTAEGAIGFQTVALAFFSIMATVPFIAVCFAVTNGFGMEGWLDEALKTIFNNDETIMNFAVGASENILALAKSGGFGIISALMFVWLVIWMMMRVEKVFNNVWGVKKSDRKFIVSFGVELGILILLPLALAFFFMGSVFYSNMMDSILPFYFTFADKIRSFVGWIIFCVLIILFLSAMYKWIPAANVKYKYALKASIIAGIAFTILQYVYIETQLLVTRINAVYGVIAVIPLFMLWMRYVWLIIIYGAQVSNSFQTIYENEEVEK